MLASEFPLKRLVGRRVRTLRAFADIPKGTTGIIDEHYNIGQSHSGVMVKWDAPHTVRDGFGRDDEFDETKWLEVI